MTMKIYENLSKEQIIKIVEESNTYDEALVLLGYKANKANRKIIKELAKQYNLSLDHFINEQTTNYLGQRFGRLTVIKKTKSKGNGARWLCQCDCGNLKEVDANHLRRGDTQSCGCLQSEKVIKNNQQQKLQNLIGQRFGKLMVIARAENVGKQPSWICKCDCGTITHPILGSNLKKGTTSSCGCLVSKGEAKIKEIFLNNNINFDSQIAFCDCVSKNNVPLKFDFGVFNEKKQLICLIEYQGIQHYYEVNWTHETLKERQERDEIKRKYCKINNIQLIEIPYVDYQELSLEYLIKKGVKI